MQEGARTCLTATGRCEETKSATSAEQAEYDLDRANHRRMRRADRRQKRHDEEEAKDQVKSVQTSGYVSDAQQGRRALATNKARPGQGEAAADGSLFASTMTRAAKELKEKAKKAAGRSPTEKVDQRACSGGGRVAASSYVQSAHLQYDT